MDTGDARAVAELPGGRTLDWSVGGLRAGKFLIRFDDGQPKPGPELPDAKAVISPDGSTYALIVDDQTVEVGQASGDARVRRAVRPAALSAIAFSPDGGTLAVVNEFERELMFWHVEDRGGFASMEAMAAVRRLAFTTAGDALLAETNTERLRWPMPAAGSHDLPGIPEAEPAEEAAQVQGPGGTPDDDTLAEVVAPAGERVRIRAIQSTRGGWMRELEVMLEGDEPRRRTLDMVLNDAESAFLRLAGGGRYVVLAAQLGFDVIELESLATVATLYHAGGFDVAVRADGATAVTVGRDLTARVWQIDSGEELNRIALPAIPTLAALSDDGRWLAAAFAGGRIELYALRPADLIAQACRWLEPPCP